MDSNDSSTTGTKPDLASSKSSPQRPSGKKPGSLSPWAHGVFAAFGGASVTGLVGLLCLVTGFEVGYSIWLFVGFPLIQGFFTSLMLDRYGPRPFGTHALSDVLGLALAGGFLLFTRVEGLICLAMAAPLVYLVSLLGSGFARAVLLAFRDDGGKVSLSLALVLPFLLLADYVGPKHEVRAITTEVTINATPEQIWPYLSRLDSVESSGFWLFTAGVAHPVRTETDVARVGAERRCVLSTGVIRETLTEVIPGHLLAFKVEETPPSMREWNPFGEVRAGHLTGYFECLSGSFELRPLSDGRTRVIGTSTYRHRFRPRAYWGWWTDRIVREVHLSVMSEVKRQVER